MGVSLEVTKRAVEALGLKIHGVMTPERRQYLQANYETMSRADIAEDVGVSIGTIDRIRQEMGLKKRDNRTDEQKQFMADNLGRMTAAAMSRHLGLPPHQVRHDVRKIKKLRAQIEDQHKEKESL